MAETGNKNALTRLDTSCIGGQEIFHNKTRTIKTVKIPTQERFTRLLLK
jgi:hypothetical protein